MDSIYVNDNHYYRMLKPVGTFSSKSYEHYALWQPVKKHRFLWFTFYIKDSRRKHFLLDMEGFEKV